VAKSSQDFRDKLASNNIVEALQMALSEAIELKITTWVSDSDIPNTQNTADEAPPCNRMRSRINIVDGDIETEIGSKFLGSGPYSELKDFHMKQVDEGRTIIRQNLESLKELFGILVSMAPRPAQPTLPDNSRALPPGGRG
jgi:hypothetical protein